MEISSFTSFREREDGIVVDYVNSPQDQALSNHIVVRKILSYLDVTEIIMMTWVSVTCADEGRKLLYNEEGNEFNDDTLSWLSEKFCIAASLLQMSGPFQHASSCVYYECCDSQGRFTMGLDCVRRHNCPLGGIGDKSLIGPGVEYVFSCQENRTRNQENRASRLAELSLLFPDVKRIVYDAFDWSEWCDYCRESKDRNQSQTEIIFKMAKYVGLTQCNGDEDIFVKKWYPGLTCVKSIDWNIIEEDRKAASRMLAIFPNVETLMLCGNEYPIIEAVHNRHDLDRITRIELYPEQNSNESMNKSYLRWYSILQRCLSSSKITLPVKYVNFFPTDTVHQHRYSLLQEILNMFSSTLESLLLVETHGNNDGTICILFPPLPNLKHLYLEHSCSMNHPLFYPSVGHEDPTIQFPKLESFELEGLKYDDHPSFGNVCYDLLGTLKVIRRLFPSVTYPCNTLRALRIFHDLLKVETECESRLIAAPSDIGKFQGEILSRFPNLNDKWDRQILSLSHFVE